MADNEGELIFCWRIIKILALLGYNGKKIYKSFLENSRSLGKLLNFPLSPQCLILRSNLLFLGRLFNIRKIFGRAKELEKRWGNFFRDVLNFIIIFYGHYFYRHCWIKNNCVKPNESLIISLKWWYRTLNKKDSKNFQHLKMNIFKATNFYVFRLWLLWSSDQDLKTWFKIGVLLRLEMERQYTS